MQCHLLKSKIHRARLTACVLDYEGSLAIDRDLMDAVRLLPYERILVANQNSGERFETYAIPGPRGSREFSLNGGAARKGMPGDVLTIMSFASVAVEQAAAHEASVIVLNAENEVVSTAIRRVGDG